MDCECTESRMCEPCETDEIHESRYDAPTREEYTIAWWQKRGLFS